VGAPFSNYDHLFRDPSYGRYKSLNSRRRNLAVVGANDGMLHAVNMGFPAALSGGANGFVDQPQSNIGKEMWAFIPQSVIPHLQWLTQLDYGHSYYLDLTPTVVEIKNLAGQWRTILIGSLRYGGRAIEVSSNPPKYSYSEVFALDITEPDDEPTLLWRFSHPQMGLVVSRPSAVRNTALGDNWYVIVGSGPTYDRYDPVAKTTIPVPDKGRLAYNGHSNQSAKVFVFDANRGPGQNNADVIVLETNVPKSFISEFQILNALNATKVDDQVAWNNSLAYFSLNQSAPDGNLLCLKDKMEIDAYLNPSEPADFCGPSKYSNLGYTDRGAIWRLNMTDNAGRPLAPHNWQSAFKLFFNAERPVSSSVNTTVDANGRLWVLFGTGRYWSDEDSRVCEGVGDTKECRMNHINYIYGIKEPLDAKGGFSFDSVYEDSLVDVSNVVVYPDSKIMERNVGEAYLPFKFKDEEVADYARLSRILMSDSTAGYKRALKTNSMIFFDDALVNSPPKAGEHDWWRGLSYEMTLEQIAVAPFGNLESVMAFSTFLPQSASCGSDGWSFGYLLDTFTGLPKPVFGSSGFMIQNSFQEAPGKPDAIGQKPVSDHVTSVSGKSAAAVFVITGSNEAKMSQFEIVNSDGTVTIFKLPQDKTPRGGVHSWREILDFTEVVN
jgi:type IV pilus assembly protein PilY1